MVLPKPMHINAKTSITLHFWNLLICSFIMFLFSIFLFSFYYYSKQVTKKAHPKQDMQPCLGWTSV